MTADHVGEAKTRTKVGHRVSARNLTLATGSERDASEVASACVYIGVCVCEIVDMALPRRIRVFDFKRA